MGKIVLLPFFWPPSIMSMFYGVSHMISFFSIGTFLHEVCLLEVEDRIRSTRASPDALSGVDDLICHHHSCYLWILNCSGWGICLTGWVLCLCFLLTLGCALFLLCLSPHQCLLWIIVGFIILNLISMAAITLQPWHMKSIKFMLSDAHFVTSLFSESFSCILHKLLNSIMVEQDGCHKIGLYLVV